MLYEEEKNVLSHASIQWRNMGGNPGHPGHHGNHQSFHVKFEMNLGGVRKDQRGSLPGGLFKGLNRESKAVFHDFSAQTSLSSLLQIENWNRNIWCFLLSLSLTQANQPGFPQLN